MTTPRVRIAPSPSGFLHIGTAKMALMNWLFARKTGGTFILRLEDTDAERTDEAYVAAMCEGFAWLGIDWDEGPAFGDAPQKGGFGPYRQSERAEIHREAARRLVAEDKAYPCFCSKEDLEAERNRAMAEKRTPKYSGACRQLTHAEGQNRIERGESHVIRFKTPPGETAVNDLVQGRVVTKNEQIDDFVLVKPSGDPIFHLAVVVDDGEMRITHVIRGDDHLTNAAKHVLLFEALGYPLPKFAHLPMVLDERGKKYSKREHGASVLDWRDDGYLPEALINYVVLQGWSAGDDRELYTREELIEAFSLDRLGKSAAKFDLKKLQWLNGQHIRLMTPEALRDRVVPILEAHGFDTASKPSQWLAQMAAVCQEKLQKLSDITAFTDFFFQAPQEYEVKAVNKHWTQPDALERLEEIRHALHAAEEWTAAAIRAAIEGRMEVSGHAMGKYVHPMRLALTGKSVGPGLFELAELLEKETCLARVDAAIEYVRELSQAEV